MPRAPFPATTVSLLLPFSLAASPAGFSNAAASPCRRRSASFRTTKAASFTLRVAHQQVATVTHDRYQHGLRAGHPRSDTVPDAPRHVLAVSPHVIVTHSVGVPACLVIFVLHARNPARVLVSSSPYDGTQDRASPSRGVQLGDRRSPVTSLPALGGGERKIYRQDTYRARAACTSRSWGLVEKLA